MYSHNTQKDHIRQLSPGVFEVWKHEGETLADLLVRFRSGQALGEDEKITYAGRLDPMASGIVILLVGQARFKKEEWNAKKKTYEVDILLGGETDTLDMLGLVTKVDIETRENAQIQNVVADMENIASLPYPMYSSRPVDSQPLFAHARAGKSVDAPMKNVHIQNVECLGVVQKRLAKCIEETLPIISKVSGDFRQDEIEAKWEEIKKYHGGAIVQMVSIRVTVSSGTYMRSLAKWVGDELKVPALAYRIRRIKVGE